MCASNLLLKTCLLTAALVAAPAYSAEKKADPGKEQVRRLQQVQRQLEQEKSQLTAQKAAAEAELDDARKKADGEARRASALNRDLASVRSARDDVARKLADTEAELARTREAQRAAEAENKRLEGALAAEKSALGAERQQHAACMESSQALRNVSAEVLRLYERKSCFDSALQREPITGLKRVEIENAIEDLRDRLDSKRPNS